MENNVEKELLCFAGRDMTYAVDFSEVVEICTHIPLEKIPCLPEHFCGISHYKGVLISVVEVERAVDAERNAVVILVDAGNYMFGIRISGEPWICAVGEERIENVSETLLTGKWREKAIYQTGEGMICQLDLRRSADGLALNEL